MPQTMKEKRTGAIKRFKAAVDVHERNLEFAKSRLKSCVRMKAEKELRAEILGEQKVIVSLTELIRNTEAKR
jgi:hypothetical protein